MRTTRRGSVGWRFPRVAAIGAALAFAVTGLSSISPAHASLAQCETGPHRFAGFASQYWTGSQPHTYEGAAAYLTYEYGNLCSMGDDNPHNNISTTFTMVASADGHGWAQSGMELRTGESCWHHWAEQEQDTSYYQPYDRDGSCVGQGEVHHLVQQAVLDGGFWRIISTIDASNFIESSFSPFTTWAKPFSVSFVGETGHDASDVPGYNQPGYPPRSDFNNMQVQDYYNNYWYTTCGYVNLGAHADYRYATDALNCDHIRVWTSG